MSCVPKKSYPWNFQNVKIVSKIFLLFFGEQFDHQLLFVVNSSSLFLVFTMIERTEIPLHPPSFSSIWQVDGFARPPLASLQNILPSERGPATAPLGRAHASIPCASRAPRVCSVALFGKVCVYPHHWPRELLSASGCSPDFANQSQLSCSKRVGPLPSVPAAPPGRST